MTGFFLPQSKPQGTLGVLPHAGPSTHSAVRKLGAGQTLLRAFSTRPEKIMTTAAHTETGFVDRRQSTGESNGFERRQFGNSHNELSEDARELAIAIDQYKIENRRRYITFEEMHQVIQSLGYHK